MLGRFDHSFRNALRFAREEASRLSRPGQDYIGTEHVLLALLRETHGIASEVVQALGIDVAAIMAEIDKVVQGLPAGSIVFGPFGPTPRVKRAIEKAIAEAEHLQHPVTGAGHLLLSLLNDDDTVSTVVLSRLRPITDFRRETLARLGYRIEPEWLAWQDGAVGSIARSIAKTSRWEQAPILADSLEEAGCANQKLLNHFRTPAEHRKRCAVLDVLAHSICPQ